MTIREALSEYLILSYRAQEDEEADCNCADFYTCSNCQGQFESINRLRSFMETWGQRFADELAKREGLLTEEDEAA